MAKYCYQCGRLLRDEDLFCPVCGTRVAESQPSPRYPQPSQNQQTAQQPVPKKKTGLLIGLLAGGAALVLFLVAGLVWPGFLRGEQPQPTQPPSLTQTETAPVQTRPPATQPPVTEPETTEVPATEPINPFADVAEDDPGYSELLRAYQLGIVSGGEFLPLENATRAQMATFLWRAAGAPEPALQQTPFSDVPEDEYYLLPVRWAYETGVITNAEDGQFHPDDTITRDAAATFLYRYAGGSADGLKRAYADARPEDWYYPQATWACWAGICPRDAKWRFGPDDGLQRQELVEWIVRTLDWMRGDAPAVGIPEPEGFAYWGLPTDLTTDSMTKINVVTKDEQVRQLVFSVDSYEIFDSAEGYEAKEGCEWRKITFRGVDSEGSTDVSYEKLCAYDEDFYYLELLSDCKQSTDTENETRSVVIHDGEPKDILIRFWNETDKDGARVRATYAVQVPKGYDGIVVALFGNLADTTDRYLYEYYTDQTEFTFIRLN